MCYGQDVSEIEYTFVLIKSILFVFGLAFIISLIVYSGKNLCMALNLGRKDK